MAGDDPREDYWTRPELAEKLRRSVGTIDRWRGQQEGPPYCRMGREILYRKAAVTAWLESLEREAD